MSANQLSVRTLVSKQFYYFLRLDQWIRFLATFDAVQNYLNTTKELNETKFSRKILFKIIHAE